MIIKRQVIFDHSYGSVAQLVASKSERMRTFGSLGANMPSKLWVERSNRSGITIKAAEGRFYCDSASAFSACRGAVRDAKGKMTDRNH